MVVQHQHDLCVQPSDCRGHFNPVDGVLGSRQIPWSQCVGPSLDNTSMNMGKNNSINSRASIKIHRYTWCVVLAMYCITHEACNADSKFHKVS